MERNYFFVLFLTFIRCISKQGVRELTKLHTKEQIVAKYCYNLRQNDYICTKISHMETTTRLNRLRVVLAEQNRSNHWLADKLQKSDYTVSRWVTNKQQPSVAQLFEIAKVLNVDVRDLLMSSQSDLK